MKITIDVLDRKSIAKGINDLKAYKSWMKARMHDLTERAAEIGAEEVGSDYAHVAPWDTVDGSKDFSIDVRKSKKGYAIEASGDDVLFLEYGAGASYGSQGSDVDYSDSEGFVVVGADAPYGPGTYPDGKGHWNDPRGWYLPGAHGKKSFGNPPSAGMYHAKVKIEQSLDALKEEVFNG